MLIAVFFSLFAVAQKVRIGLSASPMLTWTKPDKAFDKGKIRAGFEYGLITDFALNDEGNYSISTGVYMSLAGGNIEGPLNTSAKIKLQYLSLPLLLKLKTDKFSDKYAVYGTFGTLSSFRIKSSADVEAGVLKYEGVNISKKVYSEDNPTSIKSNFFNVSLQVGAGLEYYITERTSFVTGIFFNHGFIPVVKEDVSGSRAVLNNLGLRLGIMF